MMIPDFELFEVLHENQTTRIQRAQKAQQSTPCVLKILKPETPSLELIAQFKHEFNVTRLAHAPGVINMYELHSQQHTIFMEMEDFGGDSLDKLSTEQVPIEVFLDLAIKVTSALAHIHNQKLIHKNLHPSNILWNPLDKEVRIIDFGIATQLDRESLEQVSPANIEGCLATISPEQTGRMNRTLDYRSDLYSLGATFYQLLAGHFPFDGEDDLAIVHAHIAKTPIALSEVNSNVPEVLSQIILKLLAKNAEDRYQSTHGLKQDLLQCQSLWQAHAQIPSFVIAHHDLSAQLHIPEKLYGREKETSTIMQAFTRVAEGAIELVLVAGYSGVGKTSVVREVHKPIAKQGGYFTSGKCDQFKRNIPYESLIHAFQALVAQLLTESEAQIQQWKARLLKHLDNNAQVIIDVIPEVELIVGSQPPLEPLAATEAQNRFNYTFQNFIHALASPDYPLVIFLDDLQWADNSTLKLIELFLTDVDAKHILIIGAYRDNEVDESHPLNLMLKQLNQLNATVSSMTLRPLALTHVNDMITDTLACGIQKSAGLAKLCIQKTGGNPFFLTQLLLTLYQQELITFDSSQGQWRWDLEAIQNTHISENVVELMLGKLQKLPQTTQALLQLAAALSNKFTLQILSIIYRHSREETIKQLWPALVDGFVIPTDSNYKFLELLDADSASQRHQSFQQSRFRFLHDRVQQAAYQLIPHERITDVHLTIARLLDRELDKKLHTEYFFEIVDHFNQARSLLSNAEEKQQLAEYNLTAAKKAAASSAYIPALGYIQAGLSCLHDDCWQTNYKIRLDYCLIKGEVECLNAEWNQAIKTFNEGLTQVTEVMDRCKINHQKATAYRMKNDLSTSLDVGLEALKELGVVESKYPSEEELDEVMNQFYLLLKDYSVCQLSDRPALADDYYLTLMEMYQVVLPPSYFLGTRLMFIVGIRMADISIKHGNSPLSAVGYMYCSSLTFIIKQDYENARQFGELALQLNRDKYQIKAIEPVLDDLWGAHVNHYLQPLDKVLDILQRGYDLGLETGSYEWVGYNAVNHLTCTFWGGYPLHQVALYIDEFVPVLKKVNLHTLQCYYAVKAAIHNLTHEVENWDELSEQIWPNRAQVLRSYREQDDYYTLMFEASCHLCLCIWFGDFNKAVRHAEQAEPYLPSITAVLLNPSYRFYQAMAYAGHYQYADCGKQGAYQQKIKDSLSFLQAVTSPPPIYQYFTCMLEAELARIDDNRLAAMDGYDRAIELAQKSNLGHQSALACERAASFQKQMEKDKIAQLYLQDALEEYARWGATAKVEQLRKTYFSHQSQTHALSRNANVNVDSDLSVSAIMDISSVIKATQAISQEIVFDDLLRRMLVLLVENAGAEKGMLILASGDEWVVEAELDLNNGQPTLLQQSLNQCDKLPASIVNWVKRTQNVVVLENACEAAQFNQDLYIQQKQPKSILCKPIMLKGNMLGMAYFENNLSTAVFTEERLQVLQILSSQAAISIENARLIENLGNIVDQRTQELRKANEKLEALAKIDGLTGILNRRSLDEGLQALHEEAQTESLPLSVILIDIDYFKRYNDHYGHQQGDSCLAKVAKALSSQVRGGSDLVARYGGEEFTIVLLGCGLDMAEKRAEQCRQHIEDQQIPHLASDIAEHVTLSIGVATSTAPHIDSEELIARADQALYQAKQQGRNRVVSFGEKT